MLPIGTISYILSSEAGIDIGGDVSYIVLDGFVLGFQRGLYPADGVEHGGVIPIEFLADVGKAQIGQVPNQVHGNLPCLSDVFLLQGAAKNGLVDGVELAHLADDEAGGWQGVSFGFEGVLNHPGYVG